MSRFPDAAGPRLSRALGDAALLVIGGVSKAARGLGFSAAEAFDPISGLGCSTVTLDLTGGVRRTEALGNTPVLVRGRIAG